MPSVTNEQLTTADLANTASGRTEEMRDERTNRAEDQYSGPLLAHDFSDDLRKRWESVQAGFVDEPRTAVQQADELVASAIKKLAESFADERAKLEQQWSRGDDVSTEDLRVSLRRYRAFFQRLLSL
jgi:hypothetical protein